MMRRRFPYVAAIAKSEQSSATTPPIVKSSVSFHPRDTLGVKVKTAWMRESDFGAEGPPQNTRVSVFEAQRAASARVAMSGAGKGEGTKGK